MRRFLDRRLLGLVVFCNRFRYRRTRAFFGDQGVFARRSAFTRIGGFPAVRLMEDVRFSQALDRLGKTAVLSPPVLTSPRRFLARGILRQLFQDMVLLSCESWGVCPQDLWVHYNDLNHGRGSARGARIWPLRPAPACGRADATSGRLARSKRGAGWQGLDLNVDSPLAASRTGAVPR